MLKSFSLKDGRLVRTNAKSKTKPRWIHLDNAKAADYSKVSEFGISKSDFNLAINKAQRARIASRGKYELILLNIPDKNSNSILTLGIFLIGKTMITVHEKMCKIVTSIANSSENLNNSEHAIFIQVLEELNELFFERTRKLDDEIDEIEGMIHKNLSRDLIKDFSKTRKNLIFLNKALNENRELISQLSHHSEEFKFTKLERFELAELNMELVQISDTIKIYREIIGNSMEVYNSRLSLQISKVVQRLTIVGSFILLPTLIASIYGMNFKIDYGPWNMPELYWQYGYPFSIALMIGSILVTYMYFKRKKWL